MIPPEVPVAEIRRVLIVEDDPSESEFLSLTARGLGFAADCAFDGQQALELAGKTKPDLVLLDALLPKLDGFAVLAELRQRLPAVPVIMMSGIYKKRTYEAEALRQGAAAYLVKPLSVVTVWDVLARHLGMSDGPLPADFPGVPFWRRPLPAVIADVHLARKTGLLFVRGNSGASILFFEDGTIIFVRCNDSSTRLDRILIKSGRIPAAALPKLHELVAASRGIRLGDLLVQEGILPAEIVQEALAEQQRLHLMRPFTFTEGACHFFPTEAPRLETFKLPVDVPALVVWGCRNLPMDETLVRWLPGTARKPRLNIPSGELGERLGFTPPECELLALIDGTRSVGQLRSISRLLGVESERLLAALQALQVLDLPPADEGSAPAGMAGANLPAAGDITRFSPAMLLVTGALARRTGMLKLESSQPAGQGRTIWLENGALAFASSNDPGDRLGQVLVREGLLTREQLNQALTASQERPGAALGRVLVDLKLLGPDELHRALVLQAQHAVNGLMGWSAGTFQFHERDLPVKEIVPLGLDTRQVLMAAFRTCPFADLAGKLPPPLTRLRRSGACDQLAGNLPLTALESRLLLEVDGGTTVQDLAARASEGPESALRAVHALLSMGLLEGIAPVPASASAPAPPASRSAGDAPAVAGLPALDGETTAARRARVISEDFGVLPEPPASGELRFDHAVDLDGGVPLDSGFRLDDEFPRGGVAGLSDDLEDRLLAGPATAAGTSAVATATAPPQVAAAPAGQAQQLVQLSQFFELLAAWLESNPGTVPESVLATLPPEIRQMFRV